MTPFPIRKLHVQRAKVTEKPSSVAKRTHMAACVNSNVIKMSIGPKNKNNFLNQCHILLTLAEVT